jgi:glycine dehydrogenase subunit 1
VAVSRAVHPLYRRVVATYLRPTGLEVRELPFGPDGTTDLDALGDPSELAAVAVQSPNFFGCIEDVAAVSGRARAAGALCVAAFSEPLAFGLFRNPGSQGADIACGEGQSLGIPRSFGGPGLGMFASRMQYVRNLPGRLVGETVDIEGRRGYVLTLATREQHIRREKATSNICTNNSLCALTTAVFMASLGGTGLRELAQLNFDKAEHLKSRLRAAGVALPFGAATFNEFVAAFPAGFDATYRRLISRGIVAGLPLGPYYPELANHYLLCATETMSRDDLDTLAREVAS